MFNKWFPPVVLMSEIDEEPTTVEYPYPVLSIEDITNSPEWNQENDN